MFYLCMGMLLVCFLLTIYRSKKLTDNHRLYTKVGIIIYTLLALDFIIAIFC